MLSISSGSWRKKRKREWRSWRRMKKTLSCSSRMKSESKCWENNKKKSKRTRNLTRKEKKSNNVLHRWKKKEKRDRKSGESNSDQVSLPIHVLCTKNWKRSSKKRLKWGLSMKGNVFSKKSDHSNVQSKKKISKTTKESMKTNWRGRWNKGYKKERRTWVLGKKTKAMIPLGIEPRLTKKWLSMTCKPERSLRPRRKWRNC